MLYLILSVVFSVLLLVNFRAHARFQVDTRIAILLNYPVCFLTAYFHQPSAIPFHWPSFGNTFLLMAMGIGFVITFLLSGFSTQKKWDGAYFVGQQYFIGYTSPDKFIYFKDRW